MNTHVYNVENTVIENDIIGITVPQIPPMLQKKKNRYQTSNGYNKNHYIFLFNKKSSYLSTRTETNPTSSRNVSGSIPVLARANNKRNVYELYLSFYFVVNLFCEPALKTTHVIKTYAISISKLKCMGTCFFNRSRFFIITTCGRVCFKCTSKCVIFWNQ